MTALVLRSKSRAWSLLRKRRRKGLRSKPHFLLKAFRNRLANIDSILKVLAPKVPRASTCRITAWPDGSGDGSL